MGHQYPSNIFNAMIHPIRPYGIKGMIWYQGEETPKTAQQAVNYRGQLAKMVGYYRSHGISYPVETTIRISPFSSHSS